MSGRFTVLASIPCACGLERFPTKLGHRDCGRKPLARHYAANGVPAAASTEGQVPAHTAIYSRVDERRELAEYCLTRLAELSAPSLVNPTMWALKANANLGQSLLPQSASTAKRSGHLQFRE